MRDCLRREVRIDPAWYQVCAGQAEKEKTAPGRCSTSVNQSVNQSVIQSVLANLARFQLLRSLYLSILVFCSITSGSLAFSPKIRPHFGQ